VKFNRKVAAAGVAAACSWMGMSNGYAAGSINVSVQATVAAQCIFNAGQTPVINISYDGAAATPTLTGNTTAVYRCTNGTAPTFAVTTGTLSLTSTTATSINYTVGASGGGNGTGMGAAQTKLATVTASLQQSTADAAEPGTYSGSFTLTLTP